MSKFKERAVEIKIKSQDGRLAWGPEILHVGKIFIKFKSVCDPLLRNKIKLRIHLPICKLLEIFGVEKPLYF